MLLKLIRLRYILLVLILSMANFCSAQTVDKSKVIQTILNTEELEKYLHLEMEARTPLYVLKNEYVDEGVELSKNGQQVFLIEEEADSVKNYIQFLFLNIETDRAEFDLYYKIENMSMKGRLKKVKGQWEIDELDEIREF